MKPFRNGGLSFLKKKDLIEFLRFFKLCKKCIFVIQIMVKYDVPYKVKGGYGGKLHMIVEANYGTTAKKNRSKYDFCELRRSYWNTCSSKVII
jgi:hypothetical protein